MAQFVINEGYESEKTVEAKNFREVESLVVFFSPADEKVFALPTTSVTSIERVSQS